MIEEPDIRKIAFAAILPSDSLLRADAFDTNEYLYPNDAIMPASKIAFKCHETWERLVLAVFDGLATDTVCAVACVDHDVIGSDAAGEQIGIYEDETDCSGIRFRGVRYESRPDSQNLANFERIRVTREV